MDEGSAEVETSGYRKRGVRNDREKRITSGTRGRTGVGSEVETARARIKARRSENLITCVGSIN